MDEYYLSQAGSGIGGYSGVRYQRGNGFFGRLISGGILPVIKKVLPYLGRKALDTGIDIVGDIADGKNIKESIPQRLKNTGRAMAGDAITKIRGMRGSGYKRRRRRKTGVRRKRIALAKPVKRRRRVRRKTVKTKRRRKTNKRRRKTVAADFL